MKKNIICVLCLSIFIISCATPGSMYSDESLIRKVSFDTNCPETQIKITKKMEDAGQGDYVLDACGKEVKYKRTGTVYYPEGKQPF